MVETIVHVSHSLGICTVAESVETAQQVKILRELGADVGQGYFFAKPLAVEDALMLTTMDPLPVFPLGDLGDEEFHNAAPRRSDSAPESTDEESAPPAESEFTVAAEVIGALDEAGENAAVEPEREFVLNEDMHLEANDVSLVSKRGRLLASFRKGKPS